MRLNDKAYTEGAVLISFLHSHRWWKRFLICWVLFSVAPLYGKEKLSLYKIRAKVFKEQVKEFQKHIVSNDPEEESDALDDLRKFSSKFPTEIRRLKEPVDDPPFILAPRTFNLNAKFVTTLLQEGARILLVLPEGVEYDPEIFPPIVRDRIAVCYHGKKPVQRWAKDWCTFCGGHKGTVGVDFHYFQSPQTDNFCPAFAKRACLSVVNSPIIELEGGNLIQTSLKGKRYIILSTAAIEHNRLNVINRAFKLRNRHRIRSAKQLIEDTFAKIGLSVVWVEPLPLESTGHVDMYIKVVGDKIFVGKISAKSIRLSSRWSPENMAELAVRANAVMDRTAFILKSLGFEVERFPQPPPYYRALRDFQIFYPSFLNSVIVGKTRETPSILVSRATLPGNKADRESVYLEVKNRWEDMGLHPIFIENRLIEIDGGGLDCLTGCCPKEVDWKFVKEWIDKESLKRLGPPKERERDLRIFRQQFRNGEIPWSVLKKISP